MKHYFCGHLSLLMVVLSVGRRKRFGRPMDKSS